MSKTKNSEEFRRMMDEQELMQSFHYAEQELEREQLLKDLAVEDAIHYAIQEYIEAQKTFISAQNKFTEVLALYKEYVGGLTKEEQKVDDTISMLTNMFEGFNPKI
jgi:hypothetical protein